MQEQPQFTFTQLLHIGELDFRSRWIWLWKGSSGSQEECFDVCACVSLSEASESGLILDETSNCPDTSFGADPTEAGCSKDISVAGVSSCLNSFLAAEINNHSSFHKTFFECNFRRMTRAVPSMQVSHTLFLTHSPGILLCPFIVL